MAVLTSIVVLAAEDGGGGQVGSMHTCRCVSSLLQLFILSSLLSDQRLLPVFNYAARQL